MSPVGRFAGSLQPDNLVDLAWFAAIVGAFGVVDVGTRSLADYSADDADGSALVVAAVVANPVPAVVLVTAIAVALVRTPATFLGRWSSLEQGSALRLLAAPLILLLVWQGALQAYDFNLDQANVADRLLLVAFGTGAIARPAFLLPFVALQRILATPLAFPFGLLPGRNVDQLLVIVVAALAGTHLLVAISRRSDTSPVIAVIVAAVATHFFVPGVGKIRSGWLLDEDLRFLAPNAYAAGWLGQTDGGFAATLSGIHGSLGLPMRLATIALELGAALVALHHRLFRWWLVPAIVFHLLNFMTLGYWFLGWILLEVGLIVLLRRGVPSEWLDRNLTPVRGLATLVLVVLAGTTIFQPPRLSWFDSPIGEGYRIEAIGASGATYHVPFGALAPFEEDLAFTALILGPSAPLTGPYGVVGGAERVDHLRQLHDGHDIDGQREPLTDVQLALRERSEAFLADWVERANRRARGDGPAIDRLWPLRAPTWFWTDRAEPVYRFDEPIDRLVVDRLTSLTTDDEIHHWSTTVLVLEVDEEGAVAAIER